MRIALKSGREGAREANSASTGQFHDAARRRMLVTRKTTWAKEHGILSEAIGAEDAKTVNDTAQLLADNVKTGRVTRQQIESDQRMDADRLTGFKAAPPDPGSNAAEMLRVVKYRMAVRAKALELIANWELALMGPTTYGKTLTVPETPTRKPWRTGLNEAARRVIRTGRATVPEAATREETLDELIDPGFDLPSEEQEYDGPPKKKRILKRVHQEANFAYLRR
jgi:hypothetical protein